MDQPGKVANPARGQLNSPRSAVPFRVSLLISILLRLNLVLTYGIPPEFRGGVHYLLKTAIRHRASPEFIGSRVCVPMAFTAERVRQHRVSERQGSSERVLPWQVTMDHLIFASVSPTHYWYEVGMLKVSATVLYHLYINTLIVCNCHHSYIYLVYIYIPNTTVE